MAAASSGWLQGNVALVTGGASGLGRAVVSRFLDEGAKVAVLDKSAERLEALDSECDVVCIEGDVRILRDHQRAVKATVEAYGKLDTLVANAGIWDWNVSLQRLSEHQVDAAFSEIFDVNVKGYLLASLAVRDALMETSGSIVFTLSNAALHPGGGGPLYTASKHACLGLVRQLAYELAPRVRVNGVAPAAIQTDLRGPQALGQEARSLADAPLAEIIEGTLPIPFLPKAEDYVGHYVLLASAENSRTVTGTVIECDCGFAVRRAAQPTARAG